MDTSTPRATGRADPSPPELFSDLRRSEARRIRVADLRQALRARTERVDLAVGVQRAPSNRQEG